MNFPKDKDKKLNTVVQGTGKRVAVNKKKRNYKIEEKSLISKQRESSFSRFRKKIKDKVYCVDWILKMHREKLDNGQPIDYPQMFTTKELTEYKEKMIKNLLY